MFRKMRRSDKQLSEKEINRILDKSKYGILASISENGYPYTTPLNYVYNKSELYFHSAVDGEKSITLKIAIKLHLCY